MEKLFYFISFNAAHLSILALQVHILLNILKIQCTILPLLDFLKHISGF